MLTTVLQALVERYALENATLGEVNAGAVITHTRDWNLAREALLGTRLSPSTPAVTMQQACGTSLQAAMMAAAKIASGQIDSAIAAGTDTVSDVPIVFGSKFSRRLVSLGKARDIKSKLAVFKGLKLRELAPVPPSVNEPRTFMSMGQHCELMAKAWDISREAQDELALQSHQKASAAYDAGFFDDLLVPCEGVMRDNNIREDSSIESLGKLRTAYDKTEAGTLTAGNSSASMTLQDFDLYEIHEAFAAQVLCTLKAWESADYCRTELGLDEPMGSIDRQRMNQVGSSLAVGHPFAATGARIVGTLAKQLSQKGGGKGLISICTAGGMGVSAVLEA